MPRNAPFTWAPAWSVFTVLLIGGAVETHRHYTVPDASPPRESTGALGMTEHAGAVISSSGSGVHQLVRVPRRTGIAPDVSEPRVRNKTLTLMLLMAHAGRPTGLH